MWRELHNLGVDVMKFNTETQEVKPSFNTNHSGELCFNASFTKRKNYFIVTELRDDKREGEKAPSWKACALLQLIKQFSH